MKKIFKFVSPLVVLAMVLSVVGIVKVLADSPHSATITVDSINGNQPPFNFSCPNNPLFSPVTLHGSGKIVDPQGVFPSQYHVSVDWGDGSPLEILNFDPLSSGLTYSTTGTGNNLSVDYNYTFGAHPYAVNTGFTMTVKVYHSQNAGQDATDATATVVTTCVVVHPATLHIIKNVVGGTLSASDFKMHVKTGGNDIAVSPFNGEVSPGTAVTVQPGTYAVSEDANNTDYAASFSGDCDQSGNITLGDSDNKTCTVTNTFHSVVLPECSDGKDNDNDQLIDAADPGCHTDGNANNSQSYDANDNSEANTQFTLTYLSDSNGTITGTTPQTVDQGSSGSAVTPTPNAGYHFVNWSDASTDNPRTDTNVQGNITVTANFAINTFTLTVNSSGNGTGGPSGTYNFGDVVALTNSPDAHYHFVNWTGNADCADGSVTMNADKTCTANFAINTYTLTYTANANGSISGTSPQTVNEGSGGTAVTAVAGAGFHFTTWSDGVLTATRTDINIQANLTVSANFAANPITTGHIIVDKVTHPSGDPTSFDFTTTGTGYVGFSLTDASAPNDQTLEAGNYSVAETAVDGWTQTDAGCTGRGELTLDPAHLDLQAGETLTCTFTNTKKVPTPTPSCSANAPTPIVVHPANMDHWAFQTNSTATANMDLGPGTPPLGIGSAHLSVGSDGNSLAQIRNNNFEGVRLADLSKLEYTSYTINDSTNPGPTTGDQSTYLILNVDYDNNGSVDDVLIFEPEYQHGYTSLVPDQGNNVVGTWQTWNALVGGWWSNNGELGTALAGASVQPLSAFIAAHPNAVIRNSTAGAVRLAAGGGAGAWDNNDNAVDQFVICSNNSDNVSSEVIYNFEPDVTINITTSGEGNGVVNSNDDSIVCDSNGDSETNHCTASFLAGTQVNLTVTPDSGSNFDGTWSTTSGNPGTCTGNSTSCSVTLNGNITLNAHFALNSSGGRQGGGGGGGGGGHAQCSDSKDNDGDGLIDSADPGCHSDGNANNSSSYVPSDNDETNGQVLGASVPVGQVLGASTEICSAVESYMRRGHKNDVAQVKILQGFLNTYMHAALAVDSLFGPKTEASVKAFQLARKDNVLTPWHLTLPTGIFYKTSLAEAKRLMCPDQFGTLPIPTDLIPWSKNAAQVPPKV